MTPDQQTTHRPSSRFVGAARIARQFAASSEETPGESDGADASLEDAAQREQEYLRARLRSELQREPTPEELSEWLREHTEGY